MSLEEVVGRFNQAFGAINQEHYPILDEAICRTYLQVLLLGAERGPKVENHAASGRDCLEAEVGDRCCGKSRSQSWYNDGREKASS